MLTTGQLKQLHNDLLKLAHIEYSEVMDELLDHYASLTEQFMTEGHLFEEASGKAWTKLGKGTGIAHIQDRYVKLLTQQIQAQHWATIRRYFRWPTLITTLLIGVLTYLFAQAVSPGFMWISFLVFSFMPYVLFIPGEARFFWRRRIKKDPLLKSIKRYVVYRQARYGNFLYLLFVQLPTLIAAFGLNDSSRFNRPFLFEWHAGLSGALTFVAAVYMVTFIELYRNQRTHFATSV